MRVSRGEFAHDYATYSFGYTLHAELEPHDELTHVYREGFLPASVDPAVHNRFYMARSIRVPLARYEATSENRRIYKKFDGVFETETVDPAFLKSDSLFSSCFLSYFRDHHGQGVMSEERLAGILSTDLPLYGTAYAKDGNRVAYVLEVKGADFVHYWFSCYDTSFSGSSLGMWLMLDSVRRAKQEGSTYAYLGTAYGEKGRYKMNIAPLQFWDGTTWQENDTLLKERIVHDRI